MKVNQRSTSVTNYMVILLGVMAGGVPNLLLAVAAAYLLPLATTIRIRPLQGKTQATLHQEVRFWRPKCLK
jgi:hypothetical protein